MTRNEEYQVPLKLPRIFGHQPFRTQSIYPGLSCYTGRKCYGKLTMTNGRDLVFNAIRGALPAARAGETGSALMRGAEGATGLSMGGRREDGEGDGCMVF